MGFGEQGLDVVLMKNSARSVELSGEDFDNIIAIVTHTLLTFSRYYAEHAVGIGFV